MSNRITVILVHPFSNESFYKEVNFYEYFNESSTKNQ